MPCRLEVPVEVLARGAHADLRCRIRSACPRSARRRARPARAPSGAVGAACPRAPAPIWPTTQGWPCAPRPIITAAAPDSASASRAAARSTMSPLTTTGTVTASTTGAHQLPAGAALVELLPGAAVDGDHLRAGIDGAPRDLGGVEAVVVPAEPHLDRHRQRRCRDHRLDQRQRLVGHPHQRRAGIAVGDALGRAAEIDVDDVGAGVMRRSRRRAPSTRASQPASCTTCGSVPDLPSLRTISWWPVAERAAGDHLGDDEPGAEALGELAHRRDR